MMRPQCVYDLSAIRNSPMPLKKRGFHAQTITNLVWTLHYLCRCWGEQEFVILGHKLWDAMRPVRVKVLNYTWMKCDTEDKICYHVARVLMVVNRCWEKQNMLKRKRNCNFFSDKDWMDMRTARSYFQSILIMHPEDFRLKCSRVNVNARDVVFLSFSVMHYCFGEVKGHGAIGNLQCAWLKICDCENRLQRANLITRIDHILSELPSQHCNDDPLCQLSKILKHQLFQKYRILEDFRDNLNVKETNAKCIAKRDLTHVSKTYEKIKIR